MASRSHKRKRSRIQRKKRQRNGKKRSKIDQDVKNAVKELESLMDEKKTTRGNTHQRRTRINQKERRDEIRNGRRSRIHHRRPTTIKDSNSEQRNMNWFKRDFKETGDDYYPIMQPYVITAFLKNRKPTASINKIRSKITQHQNEQSAATRSQLKNPDALEKELLQKVARAKDLLKKRFLDSKTASNKTTASARNENSMPTIDSMLMDKYSKENALLTDKLNTIMNDTGAARLVANTTGNTLDDDEEEKILHSENQAIARHLVNTADDIYSRDRQQFSEKLEHRNGEQWTRFNQKRERTPPNA